MNFQEMILALQQFWAAQGCVLWNPYNVQVGAGTNNPATLLRVLGPEPWRVAYVEPCIRPDDGRYGENPNRMQRFLQYQVILKPEPGNPQELYLESLAVLGIHTRDNDIRFVEDNWQSPPLGAWGLGWEVWLNGQEIAQFTYFQQAAGLPCDPVSVEITYGLERMAMAIQGVDSVWDVCWQGELTYGDVFRDEERAYCQYYFEIADVRELRAVYDSYQKEHERALAAGAVLPAYDYVLKCNHIFNVLDARGAVGVTERAQFFRTMRGMTLACARAYLAEREALGFPLREKLAVQWPAVVALDPEPDGIVETGDHADFLLEIGVEELPPEHLQAVVEQWEEYFESNSNLYPDIFITPRRLSVFQRNVGARHLKVESVHRGPPTKIAFDEAGNPTAAALGFARSKGVAPKDLDKAEIDGGEYVVAQVKRPIQEVLVERIHEMFDAIRFPRTMRWNETGAEFSRPIRWLVALWGNQVVPVQLAGIQADRFTRGHRREGSLPIELSSASEYLEKVKKCGIQLSKTGRQQHIKELLELEISPYGEKIAEDNELLEEVSCLVENPTVLRGDFDRSFLQLPNGVLTTVMKKHQRYFPVIDGLNNMEPSFLVVCDGPGDEQIRRGNEQVLAARFADAQFFYEQDRKQPLEAYLPRLDTLTFHEKLGSMLDKSNRLEKLVTPLADLLGYKPSDTEIARQAARLCKADLATQMVVELTSLQGEMGRIYALEDGLPEAVAQAIYEHWLPRHAGDELPQSKPGILLSLADRLDSLVGLMGVGIKATASSDPYGLRRSALGIIRMLVEREIDVSLPNLLEIAKLTQPFSLEDEITNAFRFFMRERLYHWLIEITPGIVLSENGSHPFTVTRISSSGYAIDAINAIIDMHMDRPLRAKRALDQLIPWLDKDSWNDVLNGYARCARITKDVSSDFHINTTLLKEPAEIELHKEYQLTRETVASDKTVDAFLSAIETMLLAITRFFDEVLVMAEDEDIRRNRLALLKGISSLSDGIVDLSKMPGF